MITMKRFFVGAVLCMSAALLDVGLLDAGRMTVRSVSLNTISSAVVIE
jgi:hypothetical protein